MNIDNITINTQSSIRFNGDKIIYFDPYKIDDNKHDANIIFITHDHYDHFDLESINNVKNDETIIVAPKSMEEKINLISFNKYIYLTPGEEVKVDSICIKAISAYNNTKTFHPKENNWLGYIISYQGVTYYIAGDTDKTIDNEKVLCDVAFIPIGGHFTMDVNEASELIKIINPKVVIPIHYGSIIGDKNDGLRFKDLLSKTDIKVIEKLKF